ncbi:MAG TPA: ABC transporter permease [Chloroflexia bacterium]|nr:ABC transporter permease [Chloroflexia bacterium]
MTTYVIRRTLAIVPVLFFVSVITFILMHLTPGGPFDVEEGRRKDAVMQQRMEAAFGLDKPLWEQYTTYMWNALHLDLGPSFQYRDQNVSDLIRDHLGYSARLGLQAEVFAIIVGLLLGTIAALRQNTWIDYLAIFLATMGVAIPSFILSLYLILIFASTLHIVPVAPSLEQYQTQPFTWLLPTLALGLPSASYLARLARSSMLEVIRQDYIRTARSKGLRERVVIIRHIVKNGMIPVWTVLGPLTAGLITGSFIVERFFGIPGVGQYFLNAFSSRDYSMIMGSTLFYTVAIVVFNLLTDLTYGLWDPRVRVSK